MFMNQIKQVLERDGIIIIPGVLSSDECDLMYTGMWDMFEKATSEWDEPVLRSDPSTWVNLEDLYPNNSMMYQMFGLPHSQHLWDIRTNKKVVNIWAEFWGVEPEDLLVSFDGISWLPPHEYMENYTLPEFPHWFHLDQTVLKTELEGVQGWITGMDVNPGDATLIYYNQSHKMIKEFVDEFGVRTKSDWVLLNKEENNFFNLRCEIKEVTCPAGSLVIWDSRLVHCNKGPDISRSKPNYRCVSYLCYMPKSMTDLDTINKRIIGFLDMKTSNHYANRATFFPQIPRDLAAQGYELQDFIKPLDEPILNDLGKSLVGFSSVPDTFEEDL
jgi:hypothetical protein